MKLTIVFNSTVVYRPHALGARTARKIVAGGWRFGYINMFTKNGALMSAGRGRPPGRTEQGDETQQSLYRHAVRLFAERGYEGTTLRAIAEAAGVSPGLIYRYFPSKGAVVMALYGELAAELAACACALPAGSWWERCFAASRLTFRVLGPHREVLRAALGVILVDSAVGLLAPGSAQARAQVASLFQAAVIEARDTPREPLASALARVADSLQLAILLMWLIDRSADQRGTHQIVDVLYGFGGLVRLGLRVPGSGRVVHALDEGWRAVLGTEA